MCNDLVGKKTLKTQKNNSNTFLNYFILFRKWNKMSSVSFVLYIVTNRHWRSQNKPQGKKLGGGGWESWKLQKRNSPSSWPLSSSSSSSSSLSLYRFVEMIGSKVPSVVIYKASCHKIVSFYLDIFKKTGCGEDALAQMWWELVRIPPASPSACCFSPYSC